MATKNGDQGPLQYTFEDWSGLDEFRQEMLRVAITGVIVLAVAYDLWLAADPSQLPARPWPLDLGVILVVVAALVLLRYGLLPAGLALNAGLALAIVAAAYLHPGYPIVCAFALLVGLVAALHGWPVGIGSALAFTGVVLILEGVPAFQLGNATAGTAIVLIWLAALLAWISARPVELALQWAWYSYVEQSKAVEAVRSRQAELSRLNRDLGDAVKQLAAANQELERARRAAVKARVLRDQFAATVSHEMRTPLNLIIGFSEVMVESPEVYYGERLPRAYAEDVQAIYRSACHLSQLVNDILDLAQIEADHLPLEKTLCSVREIVDEAMLTTHGLFETKGLALRNEVPLQLPPVLVDRTRVRQIIINLLGNAARFTRQGGVTIDACDGDHDIIVQVRDTGSGIPREYLQQIFEEFSQADTPLRREVGGTGLGLTISKRLAELHGGNMWAESDPGRGSTFSFSLPKQTNVVAGLVRHDWDTWIQPSDAGGTAKKILAITADDVSPRLMQRYVDGYQIITVKTLQGVQRAVRRANPAAVIAIGADAEAQLKHLDQSRCLHDVPVISCTAEGAPAAERDLGVHAYLPKPLTRARLRATLNGISNEAATCLIVDDDPEIVRLFTRLLGALRPGWEVRTAGGGAEAIALLRAWRPGLVLLDLLMPGVDGYAVLRTIQSEEHLRGVPVIVVSAKGLVEEHLRATQLTIRAPRGLAAAEMVRCLKLSLDVLTSPPAVGDPATSATSVG